MEKYPRTYHLPWSLGATKDDKTHTPSNISHMFEGEEVVVTEKLDGENTTIYADGRMHARSLDSANHPSRNWVRGVVAPTLIGNLPQGWRVCGENLYARHSLAYDQLPSYFVLFSIWKEDNVCLSWADTEEWAHLLGLHTAPVLFRGIWDPHTIQKLYPAPSAFGAEMEGYVVRIARGFPLEKFATNVAKFVRANHVQTSTHWAQSQIVPNKLGV